MNKKDSDFIKKVAKKADDAHKMAKDALDAVKGITIEPKAANVQVGPAEPTQTWVLFSTPQELQMHSPSIMQLNREIDRLCKILKVKELRVTYKKP